MNALFTKAALWALDLLNATPGMHFSSNDVQHAINIEQLAIETGAED